MSFPTYRQAIIYSSARTTTTAIIPEHISSFKRSPIRSKTIHTRTRLSAGQVTLTHARLIHGSPKRLATKQHPSTALPKPSRHPAFLHSTFTHHSSALPSSLTSFPKSGNIIIHQTHPTRNLFPRRLNGPSLHRPSHAIAIP
ncbi:hypothetical protein M440DRAFT_156434 [Trichoderma longibrachiatum ATCC 18648]|uniref:Uncharacterized protein n=1 Tax=Trichoderma longibrachiatum ATCC 18648 TaxID=983965 RepID=A0A2T4BSY6_TRILO|nr:hypothetical protein M440DRAFT_156434 [Trichoderma longibrachiatum ATCC 18648]